MILGGELVIAQQPHRTLLEDDVRSGVGDIAIGPRPLGWEGPVEVLGSEELVVILPVTDPFARQPTVSLEVLADRQWILFSSATA
jgi:DNA-binding transcriptional LysR family regulator